MMNNKFLNLRDAIQFLKNISYLESSGSECEKGLPLGRHKILFFWYTQYKNTSKHKLTVYYQDFDFIYAWDMIHPMS